MESTINTPPPLPLHTPLPPHPPSGNNTHVPNTEMCKQNTQEEEANDKMLLGKKVVCKNKFDSVLLIERLQNYAFKKKESPLQCSFTAHVSKRHFKGVQ